MVFLIACSNKPGTAGSGSGSSLAQCEADSDCELDVEWTDPCCPKSGPMSAVLKGHQKKVPDTTCSQDQIASCAVPIARDKWPDISCKAGRCIASEHHHVTQLDLTQFSRACGSDGDCGLVELDKCNPCRCQDVPIATKELGRYKEGWNAIQCREKFQAVNSTITPCVHCDATVPACVDGQCTAKDVEPQPAGGECQSDADCVVSCAGTEQCCESPGPCETVVAKTKLAEILAAQPAGCGSARAACTPSAPAVTPVCKVGKCFARFDSRLPAK
ncbi:MAG: hypothetical protein QM831_17235 [Kofleriaceae bacterium]